ncbi:hypothetical protein EYC79_03245 [Agrobacterium cavarae]|uniref:Uncharacterized protein n=1 Tax=Agrobacterium cavarae TaxID=2528239 RepID=A0ABY1YBD8_9HYPH|nr:hypothetical protein EYC79_03245 [Agrobacterium cavarae]
MRTCLRRLGGRQDVSFFGDVADATCDGYRFERRCQSGPRSRL